MIDKNFLYEYAKKLDYLGESDVTIRNSDVIPDTIISSDLLYAMIFDKGYYIRLVVYLNRNTSLPAWKEKEIFSDKWFYYDIKDDLEYPLTILREAYEDIHKDFNNKDMRKSKLYRQIGSFMNVSVKKKPSYHQEFTVSKVPYTEDISHKTPFLYPIYEYFSEIFNLLYVLLKGISINVFLSIIFIYSFVKNLFVREEETTYIKFKKKYAREFSFKKKEVKTRKRDSKWIDILFYSFLIILTIAFLTPFYFILLNSFKSDASVSLNPLSFPDQISFRNYTLGLKEANFLSSFLRSLYVTVVSTALILLTSSMASWMIVRVKNIYMRLLYYAFLLAMVVPFQLVMKPMVIFTNNYFGLSSVWTLPIIYTGFGAGLSVFMFVGFLKSIPYEIEEAAIIDGCSPTKTFFRIIAPIMKPTYITVAILNVMWIWNDFLLPYSILGSSRDTATIPLQIQLNFMGSYGSVYYGRMMAVILVSIIPIVLFYLLIQKHIISGISSGAVKS